MATILIADDDPIVCATVAEYLSAEGFTVMEAEDGRQAVAIARTVRIDLMIVDMLMPEQDGLETILELRKAGFTLPILAISSGGRMDRKTLLAPALAFGANEALGKPLMRGSLVSAVRALLQNASAQPDRTTGSEASL